MDYAHKSHARFVTFEYCTIFYFFLQIIIDKLRKMRIMGVAGTKKTCVSKMNQDESRKTVKEEWIMKKTTVMLDSISAVKKFVNIVTAYDFDVDLASGRYAVDAKSIMGIFSLDLSKPIQLTAHTDDADKFFTDITEFIVG